MHDASIPVAALDALHSQPASYHVQWIRCAHACMCIAAMTLIQIMVEVMSEMMWQGTDYLSRSEDEAPHSTTCCPGSLFVCLSASFQFVECKEVVTEIAHQQCLLLHQRQVSALVSSAHPRLALSSDGIYACNSNSRAWVT